MRALGRHRPTSSSRRRQLGWRRALLLALTAILVAGSVSVALAKPEVTAFPEISLPEGIPLPPHPSPGEKLVCGSGTWRGAGKFEYEWIREGVQVSPRSETGYTYVLSKADENKEVWCAVVGVGGSERSEPVESINGVCVGTCHGPPPEPPKATKPPEISGTPGVGKTLTCNDKEEWWTGSKPITFSYLWLRDNEAIAGATSTTHVVVEEDATHKLSCRVTARNAGGEIAAESTSVLIPGEKPADKQRPKVLGNAKVNETLTCNEGLWSGSRPITYRIEWLRNGAPTGVTGGTYEVRQADEGQKLSCRVTAENLEGSATESSEAVTIIGEPIKATAVPRIEGTPREGELLECTKGIWNEPYEKLEYLWLREGPSGEESTGVASSVYPVGEADLGRVLYCQVTAYNSRKEKASATSEGVPIPKGSGTPPSMISPPAVQPASGVKVGTRLTCNEGEWKNATAFAFQWLDNGAAIPGAASEEYVVKSSDQGNTVVCRVTAENEAGATKADSAGVLVAGEKPSVVRAPEAQSASSPPHVGESAICIHGEWKGAPAPTFKYEWLRLPEGTPVGYEQTYPIQSADRGHSLTCRVIASNAIGSAEAYSSKNIVVPGSAPLPPLEGPRIEREVAVGKTVVCNPGVWGGAPPPTFKYQWLLNGEPLPGQTEASYTVSSTTRGSTLQCKVTGSNLEGSASSISKGVPVAGVRPEPLEFPFVSGTGKVGQILTCEVGIWNAKPPPSFAFQWLRDGAPISGVITKAYSLQLADVGHLITCMVVASNIAGRAEVESSNGIAVPTPGHGVEASQTFGQPAQVIPSPGVIIASLRRQLTTALESGHLKAILKHGFAFSFNPPTKGTLEVMWYRRYKVKSAHGSKHTRYGYVLLGQSGKTAYTSTNKATVRVKLTSAGKSTLKGKRSFGVYVKAVFSVPGKSPAVWTGTVVVIR